MSNVIIRQCMEADIPSVIEIFKEFAAFHETIDPAFIKTADSPEIFAKYLAMNMKSDSASVLVAETAEVITGYCIAKMMIKPPVYDSPIYGEIDSIAILEMHQRKGTGSMLYYEMKEWFRSRNVSRIEMNTAVGNLKAASFWRKMGCAPFMEMMYSAL